MAGQSAIPRERARTPGAAGTAGSISSTMQALLATAIVLVVGVPMIHRGSPVKPRGAMTRVAPRLSTDHESAPSLNLGEGQAERGNDLLRSTPETETGEPLLKPEGHGRSRLDWGGDLAVAEASNPLGLRGAKVDTGGPLLTFLISANVVPTVPSTCFIEKTINSLPKDAVKIITLDRFKHPKKKWGNVTTAEYDEYMRRLQQLKGIELVTRLPDGVPAQGLTSVLKHGLQFVKTPFVCLVQHDMPFRFPGTIDFEAIALDMARFPELKYVLFNFWSDNSIRRDKDGNANHSYDYLIGEEMTSAASNITYMRTTSWSDNNYICRTRYILNMVNHPLYKDVLFPEWIMKSRVRDAMLGKDGAPPFNWRNFGLWRYGKRGLLRQLDHLEGRKTYKGDDEKLCKELRNNTE